MRVDSIFFLSGLMLGIFLTSVSASSALSSRLGQDAPSRDPRTVTWAKLIQQKKKDQDIALSAASLMSKTSSLPAERFSRRTINSDSIRNRYPLVPSNVDKGKLQDSFPQESKPRNIPVHTRNAHAKTRNPQPSLRENQESAVSVDSEIPNNKFQRRALDFIYHKFVEPKIHKNIESRPSLIEDLMSTFESHVRKDLEAWGKGTSYQREVSETLSTSQVAHPHSPGYVDQPATEATEVSPVAQVEQEDEDTFIITDEKGQTQVITVNEIINSLAQMNEDEIRELLLEEPSVPIERSDQFISRTSERMEPIERSSNPLPSFAPPPYRPQVPFRPTPDRKSSSLPTSNKKSTLDESRVPGKIDKNDVLLIQNEDGEVRLVTVNDVLTTFSKREKPTPKPVPETRKKVPIIPFSQNPAFISLSDMLKSNSQVNEPPTPKSGTIPATIIRKAQPPLAPQSQRRNQQTQLKNTQNPSTLTADPNMDKVRQSLMEVQKLNQIRPHATFPLGVLGGENAPNSPPVKVLNPIQDYAPYQNTISISTSSPSQTHSQKSGIKATLSNFFSRLLGRKVTNVGISHQTQKEKDEFVQIIMPKSDSLNMEQITIPLPKPIHHTPQFVQKRSSRIEKTKITIPPLSALNPFRRHSARTDKDPEDVRVASSTTDLILQAANVPENVRKKLMEQMADKPEFKIPGIEEKVDDEPIERIDRIFNLNNGGKKKRKRRPVSYRYIAPGPTHVSGPGGYSPSVLPGYGHSLGDEVSHYYAPYYVPPPSEKRKKPKKSKKDSKKKDDDIKTKGPPLFDLSFLADVNHISKIGEENESYSFPKVGDPSKFIEVRNKHH